MRSKFPHLLVVAVALALTGCDHHQAALSAPSQTATRFTVDLAPRRQLDMVILLHSPCCGVASKFRAKFSKLIAALKDPVTGAYPDLRIAIVDDDLGTGGAYPSGSCGPNSANGGSLVGDQGRFQMRDAIRCGMRTADVPWIEFAQGSPVNYSGDLATVFDCLVGNLGMAGCTVGHPLQAFEYALVKRGIGNEAQRQMLRPYAQLALVFVSDEDDCSAVGNDGMYGEKPELAGEWARLRCATRGHECGGVPLTATPPGYPTTAVFSAPFATCRARMDACPEGTDTSGPTDCSPLASIKTIAGELKALKAVDHKLFVAGIFGWPRAEETESATYRIDLVPGPTTEHPQVFDYWPVCHDPDHMPRTSGYEADSWGYAGQGGLRLAAFVDEFGSDGAKFSVCERDFTAAVTSIGASLTRRLTKSCVSQAISHHESCSANILLPDNQGGYVKQAALVPACTDPPANSPCYTLAADSAACRSDELLVTLNPPELVAPASVLRFECK